MTQYEFDQLPLLLPAADARRVLAGLDHNKFYASRDDGSLRVFKPDPAHQYAYYFKCDLARMAGLKVSVAHLDLLPDPVDEFRFKQASGLSDLAILQAVASGQLKNVGQGNARRFAKAEFSAWLLTTAAPSH